MEYKIGHIFLVDIVCLNCCNPLKCEPANPPFVKIFFILDKNLHRKNIENQFLHWKKRMLFLNK